MQHRRPLQSTPRTPQPPMVNVSGLFGRVTVLLNKKPTEKQAKELINLSEAFTKEMDKILA